MFHGSSLSRFGASGKHGTVQYPRRPRPRSAQSDRSARRRAHHPHRRTRPARDRVPRRQLAHGHHHAGGPAFPQNQAAFAEMERNVIRQGVLEGVKAARARGRKGGRDAQGPRSATPRRVSGPADAVVALTVHVCTNRAGTVAPAPAGNRAAVCGAIGRRGRGAGRRSSRGRGASPPPRSRVRMAYRATASRKDPAPRRQFQSPTR